jgi:hypothetical protein
MIVLLINDLNILKAINIKSSKYKKSIYEALLVIASQAVLSLAYLNKLQKI